MMYYFFCGITFVFNCVFYRRQAHVTFFMLLKVVLTSVDRLSSDDADGSSIDSNLI